MNSLLQQAADRADHYLATLQNRSVAPTAAAVARLEDFEIALPNSSTPAELVLRELDELGSPATMASAGGRFFGFVVGAALPVTVAAGWLAQAWDQNAGLAVLSPINATLERVALGWMRDLLRLPSEAGGGFVTCATAANFAGLAAARHQLLRRLGWDVEAQGLFGAPELRVVVGEEVHASVRKALALVGFGRERVTRVPVDDQGRMRAEALPSLDDRTIVCTQVGDVNSGACDPLGAICRRAKDAGAWVHVDGAFGLWAAVAPARAYLVEDAGLADSWSVDAHKWLNVPYDNALAIVRDANALRTAMSSSGAYLMQDDDRVPYQFTPDFSRRARGVEIWAALRCLGREGLADLVERCCRHAKRFADGLAAAGHEVLNDVVLNQVLVSFGTPERTREVVSRIQEDGTCWCGGTVWRGRTAMRISVSSWATTDADVEQSLAAMLRAAGSLP